MGKTVRNIVIGSAVGVVILAVLGYQNAGKNRIDSPADLSVRGWKNALKETWAALKSKDLATFAAALAYYGTFAFFPTLVAFISIFSLVISQEQLTATVAATEAYLPADIASVISSQLEALAQRPRASLVAAIIAIGIALFGASTGVANLLKALNHAYGVSEDRGFIKQRLVSLLFLLGGFVVALPLLGLLIVRSDVFVAYGAPEWSVWVVSVLRWVVVTLIIAVALAVTYRYGPNRHDPKWQWVSWGAAAATLIWLAGSALFFFYLQNFANYQATYGIFAGIIAFMLWLNVSAFIVLLGAEVNHRIERQADAATTV